MNPTVSTPGYRARRAAARLLVRVRRPIRVGLTAALAVSALGLAAPVPSAAAATPKTVVRWFVGLGTGTQPNQISAEQAFVTSYNATNTDGIRINLEIVPNADAYDVLQQEIASGNAPDIVGPVGTRGRNGFGGAFMDLAPLVSSHGTNLSGYEPALVNYLKEGSDGQIGLPYLVYPGFIFYNKDIFTAAGLPDLPHRVGDTYQGDAWTWDKLAQIGRQVTKDSNGKHPGEAGFDADSIVQFGFDAQWADARRLAESFQGASLVAPDGHTAQIPTPFRDAWSWYYDAMWGTHFAPTMPYISSALLDDGNTVASGRIAMDAAWAWEINAWGGSGSGPAAFGKWDIAVMPAYGGQTSSPLDADTFSIPRASKNPDKAYQAMLAIMAKSTLKTVYGGMPARTSEQAAYFASLDAAIAAKFPTADVDWSVLHEMTKHPAVPSHEADMPNATWAMADVSAFYTRLQTVSGLTMASEFDNLQAALQADFDAASTMSAPTNPRVARGNHSARVSWSAPASLGSSALIAYTVTSSPEGKTCTTAGATSCTVSGLTNSTAYTFSVTATNRIGTGPAATVALKGGATYFGLVPNRLVDTKTGLGLPAKVSANVPATFQVTDCVPGDDTSNVPSAATAVTGVLSVSGASAAGWLALTPEPDSAPGTSNLNFPMGDSRSTGVTVPLGSGGKLSVTYGSVSGATAGVSFDVTGYFVLGLSGSTYFPLTPNRLVDSRSSTKLGLSSSPVAGIPATFQVTGRVPADATRNVPAEAVAVTGTLTSTNQTAAGFITLGPDALATPPTASVYFSKGDNRATGLTVKLGAGGTLSVTFTSSTAGATTDVVFDVTGYFAPGSGGATYFSILPTRLVDSRPTAKIGLTSALKVFVAATFRCTERSASDPARNIPAGAVAITGTLTVARQTSGGWLALTRTPINRPTTSNLNFPKSDNRATGVTASLSTTGTLSVTYGARVGSTTHVVFDATGYFLN